MNPSTIHVLLIEDSPGDVHLIKTLLAQANPARSSPSVIHLSHTEQLKNANRLLVKIPCDLILLDLSLPDAQGLNSFLELNQCQPTIPVVILSGHADLEMAIQAVQLGAQDYLAKDDLTANLLVKTIHHTIERHRLLVEISQRATELEHQNLALNDFAHTVAHQIQGLLSQMVGYASLVDSHYQEELSVPARQAVDQIMQSGYKMNNVITELLFLASLGAENIQVNELDNKRILTEVLKRLRYEIRAADAKIFMPSHWPRAFGYAPWVEEVWLNYISNGLKYGGSDEQPPILKIGAKPDGNGMVRFWVTDNGPGITPADQKRLFKPHTRVTSKKIRGEGVGLSIVWRIVEKCGGKVGVESQEGAGSSFWFTLPGILPGKSS